MPRALILVADGYHDRDVHDVAQELHHHGIETRFCGVERGATYTGEGGRKVVADLGYMNVNVGAYELVIVPGGPGADQIAAHKSLYNIVYSILHKGRVAATIGNGLKTLLAAAGIKQSPNPVENGNKVLTGGLVEGRTITGPEGLQEAVEKEGGIWIDRPISVAGPVVTVQDLEGQNLARFIETVVPLTHHYAAMLRTA